MRFAIPACIVVQLLTACATEPARLRSPDDALATVRKIGAALQSETIEPFEAARQLVQVHEGIDENEETRRWAVAMFQLASDPSADRVTRILALMESGGWIDPNRYRPLIEGGDAVGIFAAMASVTPFMDTLAGVHYGVMDSKRGGASFKGKSLYWLDLFGELEASDLLPASNWQGALVLESPLWSSMTLPVNDEDIRTELAGLMCRSELNDQLRTLAFLMLCGRDAADIPADVQYAMEWIVRDSSESVALRTRLWSGLPVDYRSELAVELILTDPDGQLRDVLIRSLLDDGKFGGRGFEEAHLLGVVLAYWRSIREAEDVEKIRSYLDALARQPTGGTLDLVAGIALTDSNPDVKTAAIAAIAWDTSPSGDVEQRLIILETLATELTGESQAQAVWSYAHLAGPDRAARGEALLQGLPDDDSTAWIRRRIRDELARASASETAP